MSGDNFYGRKFYGTRSLNDASRSETVFSTEKVVADRKDELTSVT